MGSKNKRLALAVTLIFLTSLVTVSLPLIKAQSVGSIVINADGSVIGTTAIVQSGNTYTLTANITGSIQVQKSDVVLNGSGFTLNGNGKTGIDLTNGVGNNPTSTTISNVTVENLHITNCINGVASNGGGNNTFYDDSFSNCSRSQGGFALFFLGCSYNTVSYCNFDDESIISMDYSANYNTVTENNLPANAGILVWLSGYQTVDRNYWSDYVSKYSNVTEIDSSGIGNTSYVFYSAQNGSMPIIYQDNHPLMKPVVIPLMSSNPLGTPTNTPTVPELSWLVILPLFTSLLFIAIRFRHRKTTKPCDQKP